MEMSENYDKERVLGDAGAVENVGEEGFSNDFVHVESSAETSQVPPVADGAAGSADGGEVSVIIESVDVADSPDSVNQVEHVDQDNGVLVTTADSVQVDPDDVKVMDDGGKEDMFVDCPEELVVHDRVNPDNKETMTIPETEQPPDEKDDVQEIQTYELDNGRQVQDLMDELNHLQAMLEKTVGEKESFARKYEEEKEAFTKEVANLHHQLKALNEQQSLFTKDDGESVDHLRKAEIGEGEEKILVSDTPLREMMINECFKFLKSALDERLQTEGTCRELQAILFMKDQEIEDLHANIAEFSLSQDVVVSFLNSTQEGWSQSLKALSGFQLEKDQHIEAIAGRVLTSLATAVNQEELFDESVTGKMSHVEKSTSILIEKYNQFLSEMDLLRQCLTEGKQDHCVQDKLQTIIVAACDELIELRRKEVDLAQKISHLEDENVKLVEQLDKDGKMVEMANVEIGKLKVELEQEKTKYANTKEKLSLAVTKGKALVQQRDMLKQSLAEKTSELEKCLIELQEKSSALQVAELSKEELLKSENLATSLQEALSQKDAILEKCEEILSETGAPEELQSVNVTERIRWIVDERNVLNGVSLEFQKLSSALSLIQTTENVSSLDLESQVSWLVESFSRAQVEATRLQDEISRTKEAAHNDIDCLTTSLLAEIQEKNYLQEELEDLTLKYQGIVEKEHQVSLEKDLMVNMLLEASGITMDGQEEVNQPPSDVAMLIDKCFRKVKEERNAVSESSLVEAEMFERIQTLLYLRDQELMLCEKILEEEMLDRLEVKNLSSELRVISQELQALNDEKGSLHKDFERAEEKSALLREKLSMAVKKGKGLVQERENLKHLLDEKNAEIEKLELELQQQESAFGDCRDQLNKLSDDVERIPKLEADLVAMKDQRDQLEQFLMESNNMLQRVIDSIDSIALPLDSNFEEPVEKVEWLAGYLNECRVAKLRAEQELDKVEVETNTLASKLAEAYKTMKSLEDAMSLADNNISQLVEEKRALEISKTYVEQELQKAMEEASIQTGKFSEVCATRKSLEDALSLAENKISVLINEKEDAQISRAAAESEVEKVEEEVSIQTSKLAEAYRTIKVLEDALSQVETNVSLLSEEHNNAQVGRTNLENEIRKLKEEADSQTSKLADACSTIKRLEDALSKAETNISELVGEKKNAEQEVSTLNSKLNACLEELAGTHGSLESRSLELSGHLNSLQLFLKDETLFSLLRQSFERNFESLKNMDFLFEDIKGHFVEMGLEMLQNHSFAEDFYASKLVSAGFENIGNVEMHNGELNEADGDNIASYFTKAVEEFNMRNKILTDEAKGFFTCMNEFIAALSAKLQATRDKVIDMLEHMKSLKQKVNSMEIDRQSQENTIAVLENDITVLLSACSDATQELEIEVENKLLELSSATEMEKLNCSLFLEGREGGGDAVAEHQQRISSKYFKTAEKLLSTARKAQALTKQFENTRNVSTATIEDLQNKLKEAKITLENAIQERDLNQNRVSELESDAEALQNLCNEMRFRLEDYQAKEDKMKEREEEYSSLYNTLLMKEKETENPLLSASQVKSLFDKINGIEIPFAEFKIEDYELHDSAHVRKLFYIIDTVAAMHYQVNLLSHDKEELQSAVAKQVLEIEQLRKEVEEHSKNKQDCERMKSESFELADEVSARVRLLETPPLPSQSEISEIEDVIPLGKKAISPVPSAAHVRTLRKGSSDHLALNIDSESDHLINNEQIDEDKGHVFKSLNTSGLIPRKGKMIADRIDGIWVSGGRALMSRPGARLGLIAYWLFLHIWLFGTIL